MEKKTNSKEKSNVKSDLLTGSSSALGAAVGMMVGNTLTAEARTVEPDDVQEDETEDTASSHTQTQHVNTSPSPSAAGHAGVTAAVSTLEQGPSSGQGTETGNVHAGTDGDSDGDSNGDSDGDADGDTIEEEDNPEVVVVGYGTVSDDDGNQMDVAVISIDGQESQLIDVDLDGNADILITDLDGDGYINFGEEVFDIESAGISMPSFRTEETDDSHLLADEDGDYVNDANVDDYMA